MEAPVKERLTGALILIALLVIVVPEMLSGPDEGHAARPAAPAEAGPPLRTYSLQLGAAATGSQDQSALSPKPATATSAQSAPPGDVATVEAPAETPAAQVAVTTSAPATAEAKPATASAPEQKSAAAATRAESAKQWWAQLGSFASRDNAERLTRELREAGYSVNLARVQAGGKDLYRVRAGPVPSREAAASLQTKLAAAGHKSSLVAP